MKRIGIFVILLCAFVLPLAAQITLSSPEKQYRLQGGDASWVGPRSGVPDVDPLWGLGQYFFAENGHPTRNGIPYQYLCDKGWSDLEQKYPYVDWYKPGVKLTFEYLDYKGDACVRASSTTGNATWQGGAELLPLAVGCSKVKVSGHVETQVPIGQIKNSKTTYLETGDGTSCIYRMPQTVYAYVRGDVKAESHIWGTGTDYVGYGDQAGDYTVTTTIIEGYITLNYNSTTNKYSYPAGGPVTIYVLKGSRTHSGSGEYTWGYEYWSTDYSQGTYNASVDCPNYLKTVPLDSGLQSLIDTQNWTGSINHYDPASSMNDEYWTYSGGTTTTGSLTFTGRVTVDNSWKYGELASEFYGDPLYNAGELNYYSGSYTTSEDSKYWYSGGYGSASSPVTRNVSSTTLTDGNWSSHWENYYYGELYYVGDDYYAPIAIYPIGLMVNFR